MRCQPTFISAQSAKCPKPIPLLLFQSHSRSRQSSHMNVNTAEHWFDSWCTPLPHLHLTLPPTPIANLRQGLIHQPCVLTLTSHHILIVLKSKDHQCAICEQCPSWHWDTCQKFHAWGRWRFFFSRNDRGRRVDYFLSKFLYISLVWHILSALWGNKWRLPRSTIIYRDCLLIDGMHPAA